MGDTGEASERVASGALAEAIDADTPGFRVYAVSDLHTDMRANLDWVIGISKTAHQKDVIIVAGDITDKLDILEETLQHLVDRFAYVFFTPGNHDLYHASFDTEPDIDYLQLPPVTHVVRDFSSCAWPNNLTQDDDGVARHIDQMNDLLDVMTPAGLMSGDDLYDHIKASGDAIISFSHFLPRVELMPEKRYLFFPNLSKVVGSTPLRERVEALRPDIHLFGHTHFGWDQTIDGVRYMQVALAYPRERKARAFSLSIGAAPEALQCVYRAAPEGGAFVEQLSAQWSDFYHENRRNPSNMELASWVRPQYLAQVEKWEEARRADRLARRNSSHRATNNSHGSARLHNGGSRGSGGGGSEDGKGGDGFRLNTDLSSSSSEDSLDKLEHYPHEPVTPTSPTHAAKARAALQQSMGGDPKGIVAPLGRMHVR